jgi:hypothetical protein
MSTDRKGIEIQEAARRWCQSSGLDSFDSETHRSAFLGLFAASKSQSLRRFVDLLSFDLQRIHEGLREGVLAPDAYVATLSDAVSNLGAKSKSVSERFFAVPIAAESSVHVDLSFLGQWGLRLSNANVGALASRLELSAIEQERWDEFWGLRAHESISEPVLLIGRLRDGDSREQIERIAEEVLGALLTLGLASWYPSSVAVGASYGTFPGLDVFPAGQLAAVPYRVDTDPLVAAARVAAAFAAADAPPGVLPIDHPLFEVTRRFLTGGHLPGHLSTVVPFVVMPAGPLPWLESAGLAPPREMELAADNISALRGLFEASSADTEALRAACRWAFRALTTDDPCLAMIYTGVCLESLLLDRTSKEDVSARVADAVAMLLGRTRAERQDYRKRVKATYDARSTAVHRGAYDKEDNRNWVDGLTLVREVVKRELELLRDSAGPRGRSLRSL